MDIKHVEGRNVGDIILYGLSTCVWCKKAKHLLKELGVGYSYIDVDLLEGQEKEKVREEVIRWNPRCTFPTIVLNNEKCIEGFDEQKIRMEIGNE